MSRVNIIVPMYNVAKYLPDFLESVLAQNYSDYTMFVVNDCSTDNSEEILRAYESRFAGKIICLQNKTNVKLGQTRNHGLEVSEQFPAEFTVFLDSDDLISSTFLEDMIRKADETNADMVICGMKRFEDGTGKEVCIESIDGSEEAIGILDALDKLAYINPASYNKLFRSSCIKGVRFKPMLRSEDTCYLMELLPRLKSIVYTGKVAYYYRLRADSLTAACTRDVCQSMFQGFEEMAKVYTQSEYEPFREVLETQVFIRSLVGGVSRGSFHDMKLLLKNIDEAYNYMNETFPKWKQNRYLSIGRQWYRGRKEFALIICAYMYRTHTFFLFVWIYYVMLKVLKRDIRM